MLLVVVVVVVVEELVVVVAPLKGVTVTVVALTWVTRRAFNGTLWRLSFSPFPFFFFCFFFCVFVCVSRAFFGGCSGGLARHAHRT